MRSFLMLVILAIAAPAAAAPDPVPISIVAAENFYGDIARQIAGPDAHVTSILSNPDQDPHLFEVSPSVARSLKGARIVVLNGADYDPWMDRLLTAAAAPGREVIVAATLMHAASGDNPHLWYNLQTMHAVAQALSAALTQDDPAHGPDYAARLGSFEARMRSVETRQSEVAKRYAGTQVTATEPVFGYMATALGLVMRNERFQLAVMNDTEPRASDIAAFEDDLRQRKVRLFIYNSQASDPAAERLRKIAAASHVPELGVTETEPAGTSYQAWMLGTLNAVDHALAKPGS